MRRTPALILGGGPAGATVAALLARAGVPHLLVERQAATGDALCGGFLSWRSLDSLRSVGIDPAALNPVDVTRVRLFRGDRVVERRLPAPAKGVSRHRLDTLMMAQAARSGARIERGVAARSAEGDIVRFSDGGVIATDALFLATGKHDLRGLARPAAARGDDPAIGLRVRLGPSAALTAMIGDSIELHMFDRGYAGLVMQEDGTANLCLAVHKSLLDAAGSPDALLRALGDGSPALGDRLTWRTGGTVDAVANVPYGWRAKTGANGLFRLGDQAGVIPSLAGEGMGIAIASGIRAAQAYLRDGPAAAPRFQTTLARDLALPIGLAGLIRDAAQSDRIGGAMLSAARALPFAIPLAARATRIGHSHVDAAVREEESFAAWNT